MAKPAETGEIEIYEINTRCVTVYVLGTMPMIHNRMAEKAKRELLLPRGRKTAADKATTAKHEPIDEFRASLYRHTRDDLPTRLKFPAPAFKGAMMTAALDMKGTRKAEIGRLCWIDGASIDIYGIPKLLMSTVRSADMNKTPDIRTRAIIDQWCARLNVWFVDTKLNDRKVYNLLAAAGMTSGVGDFRQEKGKGNYGQFTLTNPDNEDYLRIMETGGRIEQDKAIQAAEPYDEDTDELLRWWQTEYRQRFVEMQEEQLGGRRKKQPKEVVGNA